ncbi:MAG: dethiobiotin synthase [Gammaproteobacteria bacterium]|nr:dethiobiotin synthase [Gammaproteobacteria bacterium]
MATSRKQPWFVTGTDTGIGKTRCALAIIQALQNQGLTAAGMKPIASGSEQTAAGARNADAELLNRQSGLALPYATVNPYAFIPPIAPHIAAGMAGQTIEIGPIIKACNLLQAQADQVVVEGAGGWRVPLNDTRTLSDLVRALDAQVILVVGLRLGCINHALLSAETILRDGCRLRGWIANEIDAEFDPQASIDTLSSRLKAPLLGHFPYQEQQDIMSLAQALTMVNG